MSGVNGFDKSEDQLEDEDAAVYRRAKQAVDELHRARKFEKSIKLWWISTNRLKH